jgi:hypothetical protein
MAVWVPAIREQKFTVAYCNYSRTLLAALGCSQISKIEDRLSAYGAPESFSSVLRLQLTCSMASDSLTEWCLA